MTPPAGKIRASTLMLIAAGLVFAVSRLWILTAATIERSTIYVFAEMAFEYRVAAQGRESFYDLHARRVREQADAQRVRGGPPVDAARADVEYPPLAVAWMVLPSYFCPLGDLHAYTIAFRWLHALVDVATFLIVGWLARRIGVSPAWPMMLYALGGLALFHVLYDRIDLAMAALVAAALALLVSRAHWTIAFAVLALAVNFKLAPLVLAPAFVIGATPVAAIRDRRRFLPALLTRSATLLAFCVAIFLPFYLAAGRNALAFLEYHAERGLQVESIPANLLLLSGRVTGLTFRYGAIDVISPAATLVSAASTAVAAVVIGAISFWMVAFVRRIESDANRTTVAQAHPQRAIAFVTLLLWSAMAAAKVFSPQYLLWLLPLAPLAMPPRRGSGAAFLVVCALTTIIFPYHYFTDIVRVDGYALVPPSAHGLVLLTLRNALFVGLLIALALTASRHASVAAK